MTLKHNDIFEGTSLTRGVTHRGTDRARRVTWHTDLPNDRTLLKEAIDEAISDLGANHPDDSSLPLATVSAQAMANGTVRISAGYQRVDSRVDLTRPAKAQTSRRVGTVSLEWYRE